MKVKFVEFYQGVKTYPYSFDVNDVADLDDAVGAELVAMGKAEEVKPQKKAAAKDGKHES